MQVGANPPPHLPIRDPSAHYRSDDVTKEFALFRFHTKLVLQEVLEDLSDVEHVFLG